MIPIPVNPIKNFAQVDATLARGGQPGAAGFRWLAAAGFKSVVCLRKEHDDAPELRALAPEIRYYLRLEIRDHYPPTDEDLSRLFAFVARPENQPCFVHCGEGSGRAGLLCALYRYVVSLWPLGRIREEAEAHRVPHWALAFIGWLDQRQRRYFARYVQAHPRP